MREVAGDVSAPRPDLALRRTAKIPHVAETITRITRITRISRRIAMAAVPAICRPVEPIRRHRAGARAHWWGSDGRSARAPDLH